MQQARQSSARKEVQPESLLKDTRVLPDREEKTT